MISPQIVEAKPKKLVGIHKNMSLVDNQTPLLWKEFRTKLSAITNRVGRDLFSLQNYPQNYFVQFDPRTPFEKWAAVQVTDHEHVPVDMESLILPEGLFAVFHYVGSSTDTKIFQYIYEEWLPHSGFVLDDRPHFELLGEKYKNNDPTSEEDIWIPVRRK